MRIWPPLGAMSVDPGWRGGSSMIDGGRHGGGRRPSQVAGRGRVGGAAAPPPPSSGESTSIYAPACMRVHHQHGKKMLSSQAFWCKRLAQPHTEK
uniref:Uncharacterized protein n=1 Tax=Oryza rufipogon TaxID=4529 RepID=A0A0E0RF10_ORYRU